MPDQKISQLTAATTPLAGTETVPLVQGGANVKATVQDIANLAGGGGTPSAMPYTYAGTPTHLPAFTFLSSGGYVQYRDEIFTTSNLVTISSVLHHSISGMTSVTWTGWGGHLSEDQNLSFLNFTGLQTINFPDLVFCAGYFGGAQATCSTFTAPLLQYVGRNCYFEYNAATSLSFPSLKYIIRGIEIRGTSLTSFSMPSIVRISPTVPSTAFTVVAPNLTTLDIGTGLKQMGGPTNGGVSMTSCALNQTSVDNFLVALAALDGTNGTSIFSNRTVTITGTSSAPSATGAAAKATLIARGCTVTTN